MLPRSNCCRRGFRNSIDDPSRLDVAVILGAVGGAAASGAVMVLFIGHLLNVTVASLLFALFGLAVACALGAIVAYTAEMLMAGIGIRAEVAHSRRTVSQTPPAPARG